MRWGAGIVGGFLAGLLVYVLAGFVLGALQAWALLAGWAVLGAWFARSGGYAWARVWLSLCLGSVALPVAAFVFGRHLAAGLTAASSSSARLPALAGAAFDPGLLVGISRFAGFFLAFGFAALACWAFRCARAGYGVRG